MKKLAAVLRQKLENARRVAVLGIGSELRGDDVAGILSAQHIEKITRRKNAPPEVLVFIGGTAPENLTGEIKKFQPTHLIIIDSADLDAEPGYVRVLNPDEIGGISFCTHSLPIKVMTDYLLQSFDCQIMTIGIQPKTLTVGAHPSKQIVQAAKQLSTTIAKLLNMK
ncbi:MAG: hydrogenase 3 maturation endopeptidase HyCI [Sedimentisphaerales bacterium]